MVGECRRQTEGHPHLTLDAAFSGRRVPVVETMSDAGMVRCADKGWAVIETAFNNANVTFIDAGDTTGGGAGVRFRS
jgi:hypothetical protein